MDHSVAATQCVLRGTNSGVLHKPLLRRLLESLRLDVTYHRANGAHLFYYDHACVEQQVLDLVGGFGSLLLGHSHPILLAEAQRLLASGLPIHSQGSHQPLAEDLAQELSRRANGDYCCVFSNSGTEAVEVALKHAMLETDGRTIIALEGAFHGKTLGALQAIGSPEFRGPFQFSGLPVIRALRNDLQALDAAFNQASNLAAFVFEPIQGEGGVRPLTAEFVKRAAELCAIRGIPFISDECQTGCSRTGRFLACEELGVQPDYVLLSKSLGGGLAKVAATLILRSRYREQFDTLHTSTFAADGFSCAMALKTLALLDAPLMTKIRDLGRQLLDELHGIRNKFPDIIADVRGRGLMLGLEFRSQSESPSFMLRLLSSQNKLMFLVAGYLLHRHQIRVLPTLSDPWTLRLQPPVCLDAGDRQLLVHAIENVCLLLRSHNLPGLTDFLLEGDKEISDPPAVQGAAWKFFAFNAPAFSARQSVVPPRRVGWLCHMIDADDLTRQEPRLSILAPADRERLLERFSPFACPVVMSAVDVRSAGGEKLRLYPIMLPFTSRMAKHWLDTRQLGWCRSLIRGGIETARSLGCSLVSLGQYTSIATCNGRSVADPGIGLTSGNNYTVALVVQAIELLLISKNLDATDCTLAVVGATGNIGQTCAALLAPRFARTLLVGSGQALSRSRLDQLAAELPRARVAESRDELTRAQVVLSAVNAVDTPLNHEHFGPGAIVCDVSVPSSICQGATAKRPDVTFVRGGIASLPGGEDLQIANFPLAPGQAFGCLAEAMLLGFAGVCDATYTGSVTPAKVARLAELAEQHGFRLIDYARSRRLGSDRIEALHVSR